MSDEKRDAAFEEIQNIFTKYNFTAEDGLSLAADIVSWSLLVTFAELQDAIWQFRSMQKPIEDSLRANYPSVAARRKVLLEMEDAGNGWVQ